MSLFAGRADFPCRGAEADSQGPDFSSDHRDSPGASYGDRCPCLQVVQIFPVVAHRHIPMVQIPLRTTEIPQLLDMVVDAPVFQVAGSWSSTSLSRRRGLLPWSGLFVGPRVSLVSGHGHRCPSCTGRAGRRFVVAQRRCPMVQTVCGTNEIPQFFFDTVIDVPVVLVVRVHRCRRGEGSRTPTAAPFLKLVALHRGEELLG